MVTLGEADKGPTSHPSTQACTQYVALQITLRSCPCVHPTWYVHSDMHVGILYLKPDLFFFLF